MTEKVGLIKNPLTIIAIFAGIAEVSGTIVLPFVAEQNQQLFIWFLILFPSLLVVTFFMTLNFNNKVLYAPSDYQNEDNYLRTNKYDAVTQSKITIKESVNEVVENMSIKIEEIYKRIDLPSAPSIINSIADPINSIVDKHMYSYQITEDMEFKCSFIARMRTIGYYFKVYKNMEDASRNPRIESQGIWLGINVPLEIALEVIAESRKTYPFLSYISLSNVAIEDIDTSNDIFIGGATSSAKGHLKLKQISSSAFEKMYTITSLDDLHNFIKSYSY